jgi:hypothetical protein
MKTLCHGHSCENYIENRLDLTDAPGDRKEEKHA